MVPTAFKSMRNKEGQTPTDIFYTTHEKLINNPRLAVKDKANYGMVVATIIATIAFAASLTVPGHDVSPETDSLILQKQWWFIVFFVSNSVALFSSLASIIFFLSILTSSYKQDELNFSLQLRLMSGVATLFVAIATMVVAFTAACFLIFNHYCTWILYLVASLGFLTVACFFFILRTLFRDLIDFLDSSKAYFQTQPTNHYQRHEPQLIVFIDWMEELPFWTLYYLFKVCHNAKAYLLKMYQDGIVFIDLMGELLLWILCYLFKMYRNAKAYWLKMYQNGKAKLHLRKNNPVIEL